MGLDISENKKIIEIIENSKIVEVLGKSSFTIEIVKSGVQGVQGEKGEKGDKGDKGDAGGASTYRIAGAGRAYLYTNRSWVTNSDDNYGSGFYLFAEQSSEKDNGDPTVHWDHIGDWVTAGQIIKSITIVGRINSSDPEDVEIALALKRPDPDRPADWRSGIRSDFDTIQEVIHRDYHYFPDDPDQPFSTYNANQAPTRLSSNTVTIDYTVTHDSMLSIYYRPKAIPNTTRYFEHTYSIEVENA